MATPKPMMEDLLYSTQTLNLDQPKYQNRTVRHGEGDEVVSVVDMFLEEISTNADEIRRFFEEENLLTPTPNQMIHEFLKFEYIAAGTVPPVIETDHLQGMMDYIMEEAICYENGPIFSNLDLDKVETVLHDLVCEVGFEYPDESDIGDHTSRAAFDLGDRERGIEILCRVNTTYFQYGFAFNDWHGRKRNWPAVKILGISLANLADCVVEIIELPSIKYGRCRGDAVELDGNELKAVSHMFFPFSMSYYVKGLREKFEQPGKIGLGHCVVVTTDMARFKLLKKENWDLNIMRLVKLTAIEMKLRESGRKLEMFKEPGGINGWGPFGYGIVTAEVHFPIPELRHSNRVRNANNNVARRPDGGSPTGYRKA